MSSAEVVCCKYFVMIVMKLVGMKMPTMEDMVDVLIAVSLIV